jgi:TolB-like protein/Tfp pilus assembly protein PilF
VFSELRRRNVVRVAVLYVVAGWVVLQAADLLFGVLDLPAWSTRLVLGMLALAFPIALIFSWVYELTPEGLKKQHEVDRQESIVHETGRKLNLAIGALAGLAILGMVVDRTVPSDRRLATETPIVRPDPGMVSVLPSIAVLPFADMSQQQDQEYFADGISEELLNLLAQIEGLKVIGRTSSFQFKGRNEDLRMIGEQLGVGNILEGSVRKAGDRLRVTAQLIRASDGSHLWSESFDRTVQDIFAVQDEIAGAVVAALRVKLLRTDHAVRAVRHNTEAYYLDLQGRFYSDLRTRESLDTAVQLLREATERDPDFALAWVELSAAYLYQAGTTAQIQIDEGMRLARESARRAISIDPELAQGQVMLARIQQGYDWDWQAAEERFRRAFELAPTDADVLAGMASQAMTLGRLDEAVELFRHAIDRDPLRSGNYFNLGTVLTGQGRYVDAEAAMRKAMELSPADISVYPTFLALILVLQGRGAEAEPYVSMEPEESWRRYAAAVVAASGGRGEAADDVLSGLLELSDTMAYQIAEVHAFRGEPDLAMEWLERAYLQRDGGLSEILTSPFLKVLAGDPLIFAQKPLHRADFSSRFDAEGFEKSKKYGYLA